MSTPAALLLGEIDEAIDGLCAELGLRVIRADAAGATDPEIEIALLLIGASWATASAGDLQELRRRHPRAEVVLVAPAADADAAAPLARALGAEHLLAPPIGRRGAECLGRALERQRHRRRRHELVERLRALDPEAAREVEALAAEADQNARALDEAARLRSAFVNNISHEVRTPITVLQGMVDILADDLAPHLGDDQRELVERIRHAGAQVLAVVQGVLDLAKAEAGLHESRPARVFFPDLVRDWRRAVESDLSGRPVELVVDMPRGIEWLTVDAARLRQAVAQLLSNAAKFTVRGTITLTARLIGSDDDSGRDDPARLLRAPGPRGDTLEIVVADTGEGIPPGDRDLVFEAFRQVDLSSTRRHEGLGIGLTLVREAARLLGAEVDLESAPGRGTRFRLRLPVVAGARPGGPAARPPATRSSRRTSATLPVAESASVLGELARLTVAATPSAADAVALALDVAQRCLRPEAIAFLSVAGSGGHVVEALGGESVGLVVGTQLALPVERLRNERRAFVEPAAESGRRALVAVSGGVRKGLEGALLASFPRGRDLVPDDRRILQIVAGWLGLRLGAERLARERGELVATLGRDVKNPLGALLGTTQALLRGLLGPLPGEERAAVLRIEREVHRAVLSVLDLLDQQRAAERGFETEARSFSLAEVVDHVLARQGAAIELDGVAVERRLAADLPRCRGDLVRTDRTVATLVRALLEGLAEPRHLTIEATREGRMVELRLSAALRDARPVVEALGDPASTVAPGEGLGLRLARHWIEAQGGRMRVITRGDVLTIALALPEGDVADF